MNAREFFKSFREVWLIDTEFSIGVGDRPCAHTLVAIEWRSGRTIGVSEKALKSLKSPPFSLSKENCFIAYAAAAEWMVFISLGWGLPRNVIDPFYLWIMKWNGHFPEGSNIPKQKGFFSLLKACKYYRILTMAQSNKQDMRELALRGSPYSLDESNLLMDYCWEDTYLLAPLMSRLIEEDFFTLPTALQLGRYSKAVACKEWNRQPCDNSLFQNLLRYRTQIRSKLIQDYDEYSVYDNGSFTQKRFAAIVAHLGIKWPRTETGKLSTRERFFRDIGKFHPIIQKIYQLRSTTKLFKNSSKNKPLDFSIPDTLGYRVRPLGTKTGRNASSSSEFIFLMPRWMRPLLRPSPGKVLAYLDWTAQEIGIAAALSADPDLQEAYSTDVYLHFAKLTGAAPPEATKHSHKPIRDAYKPIVLGINYGSGASNIALTAGIPLEEAQRIIQVHQESYPVFWADIERRIVQAYSTGRISTPTGWTMKVRADVRRTTLQNWTIQATGADICRTAVCMAVEAGITVHFSVHDALCISATPETIDEAIQVTLKCMEEASKLVLKGFKLRAEVEQVIHYPDRYRLAEGSEEAKMFQTVVSLLQSKDGQDL